MYTNNELLFPPTTIPELKDARGDSWASLVKRVALKTEDHRESLAFSLMMIRLNGCLSCETDSYRAMRGCTDCSQQTMRRYKGADGDLLNRYDRALADIDELPMVPAIRTTHKRVTARAA